MKAASDALWVRVAVRLGGSLLLAGPGTHFHIFAAVSTKETKPESAAAGGPVMVNRNVLLMLLTPDGALPIT